MTRKTGTRTSRWAFLACMQCNVDVGMFCFFSVISYLFMFSTDPVGEFKSFLILNSDTVPRYEITNRLV